MILCVTYPIILLPPAEPIMSIGLLVSVEKTMVGVIDDRGLFPASTLLATKLLFFSGVNEKSVSSLFKR